MNYSRAWHSANRLSGMPTKWFPLVTEVGLTRLLVVSFCLACMQVSASAQQASVNDARTEAASEPAVNADAKTGVKLDEVEGERKETVEPTSGAGKLVLVIGASGTEEFGVAFAEWGQRWQKVAEQSDLDFVPIGLGDEQKEDSDRELLRTTMTSAVGNQSTPLWLVLIGHGTYARDVAKFNLRGPDVSAADLAKWLEGTQRPIVIINCASASGPFVNRLSGPRRVIVTATRSGVEQNYARFGEFLSEAIGSDDSDLDHDGEVSIHEAFLRASAGVRMFYEAEDRIATEHALIDDNGDGKGTPAKMFRGVRPNAKAKEGALDGAAALRITVAPSGGRLQFTPLELKQRAEIEDQIDALRGTVGELDQQALDAALLPLMLRISRLYQTAEERQQAREN